MGDDQGAVVVVGGAGSLGMAVVNRYLVRGVGVIVIDRVPISLAASETSERLRYVSADVTQDDDIAHARESVEELGWDVRHMVSLAGGAMDAEFGALAETSVATIRYSIELNLTSHVLLTRAFLPVLARSGHPDEQVGVDRSVTLVSSINALRDYGLPAYSAGKAGMIGLARSMASELGSRGIRINVVVPGTVVTGSSRKQPKDFDGLRRGTALGRLALPDDIAAAITASSHDLRAMTGQLLVIDCGQTVATPAWRLDVGATEEGTRT